MDVPFTQAGMLLCVGIYTEKLGRKYARPQKRDLHRKLMQRCLKEKSLAIPRSILWQPRFINTSNQGLGRRIKWRKEYTRRWTGVLGNKIALAMNSAAAASPSIWNSIIHQWQYPEALFQYFVKLLRMGIQTKIVISFKKGADTILSTQKSAFSGEKMITDFHRSKFGGRNNKFCDFFLGFCHFTESVDCRFIVILLTIVKVFRLTYCFSRSATCNSYSLAFCSNSCNLSFPFHSWFVSSMKQTSRKEGMQSALLKKATPRQSLYK